MTGTSRISNWSDMEPGDLHCLAYLYRQSNRIAAAEKMYMRALQGYEKAWGAQHPSTLDTANSLGMLYADQGKMAEAEAMYLRALQGKEKAWRAEHIWTLDAVRSILHHPKLQSSSSRHSHEQLQDDEKV